MNENTHKEWNLVVLHAIIAYAATLAHVPTIIWQLTFTGDSFLRDSRWLLGTRLGLHGAFSIIGIISLYFLNRTSNEERIKSVERFVLPSSTKLKLGKEEGGGGGEGEAEAEEVIIGTPLPNLSITENLSKSYSPETTSSIELQSTIGYQQDIYKVNQVLDPSSSISSSSSSSSSSLQIVNNERLRDYETLTTRTIEDQMINSPKISGRNFSTIRKPVSTYYPKE
ncbi:hypothetical protein CROQUDRAFT_95405 [Cronartium quercuum f. sp. fusiforme G11]|uniref:Uncharacterized protein n=1 Tax=Cronartium quercuum f. sp. fusiforme G11 TaxID=708437 RepID=A0A9P6NH48_9BASI|nr:hypothetical protein CROQUDRAFT_95405 [Cronartium quercuum f. sp. fusiforme G11]